MLIFISVPSTSSSSSSRINDKMSLVIHLLLGLPLVIPDSSTPSSSRYPTTIYILILQNMGIYLLLLVLPRAKWEGKQYTNYLGESDEWIVSPCVYQGTGTWLISDPVPDSAELRPESHEEERNMSLQFVHSLFSRVCSL